MSFCLLEYGISVFAQCWSLYVQINAQREGHSEYSLSAAGQMDKSSEDMLS
jgi:hypothetical protein